jgi:hypothetical protein
MIEKIPLDDDHKAEMIEKVNTEAPVLRYTSFTRDLIMLSLSKDIMFTRTLIICSFVIGANLVNVRRKIIKGKKDKRIKNADMAPKAAT